MIRNLLAGVVASVLVVACGSHPCTMPCAEVAPATPKPAHLAPGFDVLITDQNAAVSVRVGQKIEVYLVPRQGMTPWAAVKVEDSSVLEPIPLVDSSTRSTLAGFIALKAGSTRVTSTAGPQCSPGQACPAYAVLFSATVIVS